MSVVALRLGWHLLFKLDRYDWHYNKISIWVIFIFSVIFWPLILLNLNFLIFPSRSFDSYGTAECERERDRLLRSPPKCGEVVRYSQKHSIFDEEVVGEFLFESVQIEAALERQLENSPSQTGSDYVAILNWIRRREINNHAPADVPESWTDFKYIANELTRSGEGKVYCKKCEKIFPTGTLIPIDDKAKRGWNFERLLCGQGHKLLIIEKGHILC